VLAIQKDYPAQAGGAKIAKVGRARYIRLTSRAIASKSSMIE
jgi:hypothetical protein